MPAAIVPLTDTVIRKAKAPAKGQPSIKMRDGAGLYLLLGADGSRRWCLDYRRPLTGKRNTLGLGVYPHRSLWQSLGRSA